MACGGGNGDLGPHSGLQFLEEDLDDEEEWERIYSHLNRDNKKLVQPLKEGTNHIFNRVKVAFPYAPYKSQKQLMSKTIEGVNKIQNCLLESPTGTGKTAALLCSLLGWQKYCRQNNLTRGKFAQQAAEAAVKCTCGFIPDPTKLIGKPIIKKSSDSSFAKKFKLCATFKEDEDCSMDVEVLDGANKSSADVNNENTGSPSKKLKIELNITREKDKDHLCRHCIMSNFSKPRVPKIFYTTRTHSQIQQVVDQLTATSYRNTRMTILASRKVGCINDKLIDESKKFDLQFKKQIKTASPNPVASTLPSATEDNNTSTDMLEHKDSRQNMDESCRNLRKNYYKNLKKRENNPDDNKQDPVCKFYDTPSNLIEKLEDFCNLNTWDVEDLKTAGRECNACPYYGSQALYEDAEIVFCPYNYVICPAIRSALGIDLTGNIVLFDEAHNLEDICRDEASMNIIDLNKLDGKVRWEIDNALAGSSTTTFALKKTAAEHFSMILRQLSTWMRNASPKIPPVNIYTTTTFASVPKYEVLKENRMLKSLEDIGFGRDDMDNNMMHLNVLTDEDNQDGSRDTNEEGEGSQKGVKFNVPTVATRFIAKLLGTLQFLYEEDNYKHYNIVIANNGDEIKPWGKEHHLAKPANKRPVVNEYNVILEIMCLSPAIAFKTIRNQCHSIIVTSGTLSPLNSFAVELNTPFQVRLIAEHVINNYQTFCSCIQFGSNNNELYLNKKGQKDLNILDDLGDTIKQICENVPHGVLVFLPSYTFMDAIKFRWSHHPVNNPIMKQIECLKTIFYEERADKDLFEGNMKKYKELINHPVQNSNKKGCILFAIFRGKVSEGINFTDDQSRAVVSVGIPFANFGSYSVKYKMEYNDERIGSVKLPTSENKSELSPSDLLSGDEWYDIQAFRAMNQGFGRCIRHKDDWGAIILLDSRMSHAHNNNKLSGWVKNELQTFKYFEGMQPRLAQFIHDRINNVVPTVPKDKTFDNSILSVHMNSTADSSILSVHMDSDDDEPTGSNSTQLTQICSGLNLASKSRFSSLPVNLPSCSNQYPVDLDSSSYSLDESDCYDIQNKDTVMNVHDLPTQLISSTASDNESVSCPSSPDMIEGTP